MLTVLFISLFDCQREFFLNNIRQFLMRQHILSGNKKKYTEKTEGHQNHNSGGGGNRLFFNV